MYNYKNKRDNIKQLNKYMLSRTLSMFNYSDLPTTLPSVEMEKQLQKKGYTFITMVEGSLYAFQGGLGGEPNPYGQPTKITINNPSLNYSATLDIEKDGVLIKNDDMMMGLFTLFDKYNTLLIENEITMFINSYNTRVQTLLSAGDDSTKESAELYLKKVIEGELGIIGENQLFEDLKVQKAQADNANVTTQLIEFNQYLKASLYNEVGLNANFNMKRERLNSSEVKLNTDNLYPLIHNMLENRKQGIEKLNEMYDLQIGVEFGSIWNFRNISDTIEEPKETIDEQEEPTLENEEPSLEQEEPILEDEEPTLENEEPISEDEEPISEDEEPISEDESATTLEEVEKR